MLRELTMRVSEAAGEVGGLLLRPDGARWLLVLAHGMGAGMRHPFMESLARELAAVGVATLRYHFPYFERGSKRPDPPAVLQATVRAAIEAGVRAAPDLSLLVGGKSMGGRMTSLVLADASIDHASGALGRVRGLVFYGFPLHPAGRPDTARAAHLSEVRVPMLFLQGTRDTLADVTLLRQVCATLPQATLQVIETANHAFHVLKRSGRSDAEVLRELAQATATWAAALG